MKKPLGASDLLPGIVAVLGFLGLAFGLGWSALLAAPLAAMIYAGVWLIVSRRVDTTTSQPRVSDTQLIQQLYNFQSVIKDPLVRGKLAEVCRQSSGILSYFGDHPDEAGAWKDVFHECLDSTLRIVRGYAELTRHLAAPPPAARKEIGALLDQVSQTLANLLAKLVDDAAADLSNEASMFRSTLQALNEVSAASMGTRDEPVTDAAAGGQAEEAAVNIVGRGTQPPR